MFSKLISYFDSVPAFNHTLSVESVLIHGIPSSQVEVLDKVKFAMINGGTTSSSTIRYDDVETGRKAFRDFPSTDIPIYQRLRYPIHTDAERRLTYLETEDVENYSSLLTNSGMSAINLIIHYLTPVRYNEIDGEAMPTEIVSSNRIYGCTQTLFREWMPKNFGKPVRFADFTRLQSLEGKVTPDTQVVFFETPTNPGLSTIDIEAIFRFVKTKAPRAYIVVDNTFSPLIQRPIMIAKRLGLGERVIVMHSVTKNLNGFGTDIGGSITFHDHLFQPLLGLDKDMGGAMSMDNVSHLLTYSFPTLFIRVKRQLELTKKLVDYFSRPELTDIIENIKFPGLKHDKAMFKAARRNTRDSLLPGYYGTVLTLTLKGGLSAASRFFDFVARSGQNLLTIAVSLGETKTLVEHPAGMTHAVLKPEERKAADIEEGDIRISVGLESLENLIAVFTAALEYARG